MPRRRIDPLALKAAIAASLAMLLVGTFAKVVIDSEQRSLDAAGSAAAREQTAERTGFAAPSYVDPEIDLPARSAAETSLAAAKAALARDGSFANAGPGALSVLGTGLIFVEGPSAAAEVVSLASSRNVWAAAVMGGSGTCFYARATTDGVELFGTGSSCTGEAALSAVDPSWDLS